MKRPIFIIAIASINGILIGIYFKQSISLFVLLLILLTSRWLYLRYKGSINKDITNILIIYLLSSIIFGLYTNWLNKQYEEKYSRYYDKDVKIIGTIISDVKEKDYTNSYRIKISSINGEKIDKDTFILKIKKNKEKSHLDYGDKIYFNGLVENTKGRKNENGFDYKFYLKTIKIYGIMYTESDSVKILKKDNMDIIELVSNKITTKIKNIFYKSMPGDTSNLELGILLGYTEKLDKDLIDIFKDSSIIHMIAVSGQHIAYLEIMAQFLIKRKNIGIRKRKIILILLILFFMKLTGETVSIMRAGICTIISILASLIHRKNDIKNTIAISILINIISNPFSIFQIGMKLSYAGTIGILLFYKKINNRLNQITNSMSKIKDSKIMSWINQSISLTISASIFILPISVHNYSTISLSFVLSNLIIAPLIAVAMIYGIILILISLLPQFVTNPLFLVLNYILKIIIQTATFFSKLKISKIYICTPTIIETIILYLIILLVFYRKSLKNYFNRIEIENIRINVKSLICIATIIAILGFTAFKYIPQDKIIISFIDVGQGDSMLIETPYHKKILIDGGGSMTPENYDIGEQILIPFLLAKKIKIIDYVLISHFDTDHVRTEY